jgi:cell wall-associated NlpC family hydrolase
MPSSLLLARLRAVIAGTAITAATLLALAPTADAVTVRPAAVQQADGAQQAGATQQSSQQQSSQQQSGMTARQRFAARADRVLHVASNQKGDPYRYGAAGPDAFDCSGLVYYTFRKALGRTLPRVANDQKRASKRIWHRRNLRPGDLVFEVDRGGYAYHVGIYAGHGYFWHSPHSGSHVQRQHLYPSRWRFGRIIKSS